MWYELEREGTPALSLWGTPVVRSCSADVFPSRDKLNDRPVK